MILLHGRGASAEDILSLAAEVHQPGFAYLAPQAAGSTWYPYRFTAPTSSNEPWLSSALRVVGGLFDHLRQSGISPEQVLLLGFSQGACLALEYAKRNPRRYGGLAGLSGGLIGAEEELTPVDGSMDSTPVFLGCSENDPHIAAERVRRSAEIFESAQSQVTMRLYPLLGHTVNQEELEIVKKMMELLLP
jgi:predicted esterase